MNVDIFERTGIVTQDCRERREYDGEGGFIVWGFYTRECVF